MWCLRCYEPVRQLTPREPQLAPLPTATVPRVERPRSRWKAGATTFGPVGRIAITIIVLLFAPTSLDPISLFIYWPCYLALAFVILRSTWANDLVDLPGAGEDAGGDASAGMPRLAPGEVVAPPVRAPLPRSTLIAWVALAALGGSLGFVWAPSGHVGRGIVGIVASLAALVLWLAWVLRG
jgi:hypothetical protein